MLPAHLHRLSFLWFDGSIHAESRQKKPQFHYNCWWVELWRCCTRLLTCCLRFNLLPEISLERWRRTLRLCVDKTNKRHIKYDIWNTPFKLGNKGTSHKDEGTCPPSLIKRRRINGNICNVCVWLCNQFAPSQVTFPAQSGRCIVWAQNIPEMLAISQLYGILCKRFISS